MKSSRNEKLSEHLLNVDEEILANAYEVDDAEKLKRYIKAKDANKKKPFYMTPVFRRVATIAACFVLIIGVILSIPALIKPNIEKPNNEPDNGKNHLGETIPPSFKTEDGYLTINSISQLNYYAAVRMITEGSKKTGMTGVGKTDADRGIVLLAAGSGFDKKEEPPVPEITAPSVTQEPAVTPNDPAHTGSDRDIYYYSLDPNEPFYINRVSMFRIELTDENGFLASELGLGVADVVITEECIWGESMITFRNGEKFFSCLTNGWGYNSETGGCQWAFSTHKYVEGFFIVKNLAQENYGFRIEMDAKGQVISFYCHVTENGGPRADQDVKVVGSTVVSNEGRSFTVAELENYFNSGKLPDNTHDTSHSVDPSVSGEIPEAKDTTLEFWIAENVENIDFSQYNEIYGWRGAREFYGKGYSSVKDENGNDVKPEHYVTYLITAYPDCADGGQYVTRIEITDPSVSVYGLTVNSTIEEYDAVFRKMGYAIFVGERGTNTVFTATAPRAEITFELCLGHDGRSSSLTIQATVTNRDGIVL